MRSNPVSDQHARAHHDICGPFVRALRCTGMAPREVRIWPSITSPPTPQTRPHHHAAASPCDHVPCARSPRRDAARRRGPILLQRRARLAQHRGGKGSPCSWLQHRKSGTAPAACSHTFASANRDNATLLFPPRVASFCFLRPLPFCSAQCLSSATSVDSPPMRWTMSYLASRQRCWMSHPRCPSASTFPKQRR